MSLETMTKLATTTVGAGGVAAVEFLNIPQGYTDLKVVCSTRTSNSNIFGFSYIYFNGSQVSYSQRVIEGTGAGVSSYTQASTYGLNDDSVGNTSTSSTFSNGELYIPNYSASSFKSFSFDTVGENNATTAYSQLIAGLWSNPSPITRITFSTSATSLSGGTPLYMQNSTFTLYGIKNARQTAGNSIKATGGNIVFDGTYVYHVFNSTGSFTPTQPILADALVVAGGGGGSGGNGFGGGAGGGAGGLLGFTSQSLSATSYTVTVGAGGSGTTGDGAGSTGIDSQFGALTIVKGGGGGGAKNTIGLTGGSGGGGGTGIKAGGSATSSQGFAGGSSSAVAGGGGGGAGAIGSNGTYNGSSNGVGGNGGAGSSTYSSWFTATGSGIAGFIAGGGAGGSYAISSIGNGGSGGGANGGNGSPGSAGSSAISNTGGGGGGGGVTSGNVTYAGGNGGSGLIVIRYKG